MVRLSCVALVLASSVALVGCGDDGGSGASVDPELRAVIAARGLTGDPSTGRLLPSIGDPLAQLGLKLFFSKSLGGDLDSACVSCHHPVLGGGDALPLSIGVGADDPDLLGPGRIHPDGDFTVPRNAPTTFNIALWDQGLFWDVRVESLGKAPGANGDDGRGLRTPDSFFDTADPEAGDNLPTAQARFPVTSADEMRGFDFVAGGTNVELRTALEARLVASGSWSGEFAVAFGDSAITYDRIATAIGEYERSQIFVDTPWRAYVQGDDAAIAEAAKRGALLFLQSVEAGGANCAKCHAGDFFTDEIFWAIAAPQVGRGKGDGPTGTNDYGRARESGEAIDRFAFRTPTLLSVAETGPYLHDGAYDRLEDVIRHHLDPRTAIAGFDRGQVAPAFVRDYEENMAEVVAHLEAFPDKTIDFFSAPLALSDGQVRDLVAFLGTLLDPCVVDRACLAPWIPDAGTVDPDGNLLRATDADGEPL